jgi:hypothetical protein
MFALTTLVYPCLLAGLCLGCGLLIDRLSGRVLPGALLAPVGGALLIAVSQLMTYDSSLAPATPTAMVALALLGYAVEAPRLRRALPAMRPGDPALWLPVLVYGVALAPVLLAGRPSFSAFGLLTDSAFHMMGADYLIRHGQQYGGLDLANSYGQYISSYYGTSYPSGADTLFGGSAFVLGLPLIWAFQPFNAFMLALASGPILLLARRIGLSGALLVVATLTASVPALVYGYELIASVKELAALPLVLTLGALVATSERWLRGPPRGVVAFALVAAGGLSALGIGFAAWIGATGVVLAGIVSSDLARGYQRAGRTLLLALLGALVTAAAALPTVLHLSASLQVAQTISTTGNAGNLHAGLRIVQAAGTWLTGLYTSSPSGLAAELTDAAIGLTAAAAVLGVAHLLRRGRHSLVWWLVAMLALGIGLTLAATTWVDAKTLMLSSPIVLLLAWAGVAALSGNLALRVLGFALALVLAGGVLVSDALQYNATDLAPTARYDELASINTRFAGRGPTLFVAFDEYSLYVLRDLDVGGPDFLFPPPALSDLTGHHHGYPVDLDAIPPRQLVAYPLIVTRVNPAASRPPSAYSLLWQGSYYQVWGRLRDARPALYHLGLHVDRLAACRRIERVGRFAVIHGGTLVAAAEPRLVGVPLTGAGYLDGGLTLTPSASLHFRVPSSGRWELWLRGEVMPTLEVSLDRRPIAKIGGQLDGNEYNPDTLAPIPVRLARGPHTLSFAQAGSILAPGDGGTASVSSVFLAAPGAGAPQRLIRVAAGDASSLCAVRLQWIEAVRD